MLSETPILSFNHQQLYSFWVVAQEGSITKACSRLFLAQPTVSGQIIQLEKHLKTSLFQREKNRLILTDQGQVVFQHANTIFGATRDLLDSVREGLTKGPGRLLLGIDAHITKQVALRCLHAVQTFRPGTPVTIHEGALRDLIRELHDREIDLILSDQSGPAADAGQYRRTMVGRIPIFFVAAPELARHCQSFPRDLSQIPLLLPTPASPLRSDIDQYLAGLKMEPRIIGEIADADFMRILAIDGQGAAPLHILSVASDLRAGRLLRLGRRPTGLVKTLWLIGRAGKQTNQIVHHLLEKFRIP